MIVLFHKHNRVQSILETKTNQFLKLPNTNIVSTFFSLSKVYENKLIVWCEVDLKNYLNFDEFNTFFHHKLVMASFNTRQHNFLSDRIGYVEPLSPFIKINKYVKYPTWLMSADVGAINSSVVNLFIYKDYKKKPFEYVLNSMAKLGQQKGLFCYSNPFLITETLTRINKKSISKYGFFSFVKEHYKLSWVILAFFNVLIYEKKLFLISFLRVLFNSKKKKRAIELNHITALKKTHKVKNNFTIDVIIPTIGRKAYLYDVLKDLSRQTLLPVNVIIIEQNPDSESKTDLDYIENQIWPFKIKHKFIRKTGACHARNIGLAQVESDWVFLADDDIRFENTLLEIALEEMYLHTLKAATLKCLREQDADEERNTIQWGAFGSGCSIISKPISESVNFDVAFEHGFGEDIDYGMQIRNLGFDVGFLGMSKLKHLKAPVGGFRTRFLHPWGNDEIQPKPSPTVMLCKLKHNSKYQLKGYKTLLFLKFYGRQNKRNPISYFFSIKKRWNKSICVANELKKEIV